MSQAFLTKSGCEGVDLEPIALVGHDEVLTRGRRSTKEGGALLTPYGAILRAILPENLIDNLVLGWQIASYFNGSLASVHLAVAKRYPKVL